MKIFRSTILGDETTPPIELESLTIEDQNYMVERLFYTEKIKNLQQIINDAEKIIEKTKTQLDNLQKSCKHHYFYDEEGYPYNYRYCAICKAYMGPI